MTIGIRQSHPVGIWDTGSIGCTRDTNGLNGTGGIHRPGRPCNTGSPDSTRLPGTPRCLRLHRKFKPHLPCLMFLRDIDAADPRLFDSQQAHRPEQPRVRETRRPVPPEHTVRLAKLRHTRHSVGVAPDRIFPITLGDIAGRRMKHDMQLIALGS